MAIELPDSPKSDRRSCKSDAHLTNKEFIRKHFPKFIIEMVGTCLMGMFYNLIGESQAGIMLGMWILTLFGHNISGAHYNPCVTLVYMLRKEKPFHARKLYGLMLIFAQLIGGILQAIIVFLLDIDTQKYAISPAPMIDTKGKSKAVAAVLSEFFGTYFFVFMFMIAMD